MVKFQSFSGIVLGIDDFVTNEEDGCYKVMAVSDGNGNQANFVVSPDTYFLDQAIVEAGDRVTGIFDANAPVPLIFPPQYRALAVAKEVPGQNVKADFFNNQLISSDGMLKLNLSPYTWRLLRNGQPFSKFPGNRNLIAVYGASTKSIPAQTTPYKIIVWC